MNPGPAPRPPIDRPRLHLMPSTTGVPGNMSQTSLHSPALRSAPTYSSSGTLTPSLSRSTTLNEDAGGVAAVKEGAAKCKEDGFGALVWKSRWLVLRSYQIDIQKAKNGKVSMTILLKDVTSVSRCENTPSSFEIVRVAKSGTNIGPLSRDLPQKTLICQVKSDDDIYDWIDSIYSRCPGMGGVSNPTNFSHRVHVGFDPVNGSFVGLPVEWERLLTASAITKEDYQKNPQAVLQVLEFYSDITKRSENPDAYPSLTPTPPVNTNQNMQLGYGGGGTAIAPPRPIAPGAMNRLPGAFPQPPRSQTGTPIQSQRKPSGQADSTTMQLQDPAQAKLGMDQEMRRKMEEEARKVKQLKEQRERDRQDEEEQNRVDQEIFNAAIPKTRTPIAKQELGGYAAASDAAQVSGRYNPTRNPPPTPGVDRQRQRPQGSLRQISAQRQVPQAPNKSNGEPQTALSVPSIQRADVSREQSPSDTQRSLRAPNPLEIGQRQPSPGPREVAKTQDRNQPPRTRAPANVPQTNGTTQAQLPTRLPAPVQTVAPLNVVTRQPTGAPATQNGVVPDGVQKAGAALTQPPSNEARSREVRMSSMTESEVMEKLKSVVSKDNPEQSYNKQKKIGQGASGSVYVARIKQDASSPIAKALNAKYGNKAQVAIKQMDLRNQPRKELIVNEIIVMKESRHPNIVNFLDSFLQEGNNELWVVMEFMEGGALTDVIDNNPVITEDQISAICNEVSDCGLDRRMY